MNKKYITKDQAIAIFEESIKGQDQPGGDSTTTKKKLYWIRLYKNIFLRYCNGAFIVQINKAGFL